MPQFPYQIPMLGATQRTCTIRVFGLFWVVIKMDWKLGPKPLSTAE